MFKLSQTPNINSRLINLISINFLTLYIYKFVEGKKKNKRKETKTKDSIK